MLTDRVIDDKVINLVLILLLLLIH